MKLLATEGVTKEELTAVRETDETTQARLRRRGARVCESRALQARRPQQGTDSRARLA